MPRLRLFDCRYSRLPQVVGLCADDIPGVAAYVNSAQRRLLMCRESGDEGWYGTFAEMAFNLVSRSRPYIVCPREVARIENINICKRPIQLQNQFYEYLQFGNGRMPQCIVQSNCQVEAFSRNDSITIAPLVNPPKIIRAYWTDAGDISSTLRVFIQGLDQNNTQVYTQDGFYQVMGEYLMAQSPFADTQFQYNSLTGIQKDITLGAVQIFQVDPTTGAESLMLTMEPNEQVAGYRRYYLNNLPTNCCGITTNTPTTLQVTALVKLELLPVYYDTDYLLFHNLEAIIEECSAIRYSEVDSVDAKKMALEKHQQAIRFLNGELAHYYGINTPAVNFSPFGSAKLERQAIGTQI